MAKYNNRTRLLGKDPIIPEVFSDAGQVGLVSVIIPTYNRAYIVATAIESVLNQTYTDLELIIVDDGSTDDTRAVVGAFGSRVHYVYQSNGGLAAARNTGLAAARGEFIAFQDSDDLWLPWKIEAQMILMRRFPDLSLTWTDMAAIDPQGRPLSGAHLRTMYSAYAKSEFDALFPAEGPLRRLAPDAPEAAAASVYRMGDIRAAMTLGNLVHPPTALIRRSSIRQAGGLDLTFAWTCEDYEFFWRVSRHGPAALLEVASMLYRVNAADQLTRPELALHVARGNMYALQRHASTADHGAVPTRLIRLHLADSHGWLGREELVAPGGSRRKAIYHLLQSLRYQPWQRHTSMRLLVALVVPQALFGLMRLLKRTLGDSIPQRG